MMDKFVLKRSLHLVSSNLCSMSFPRYSNPSDPSEKAVNRLWYSILKPVYIIQARKEIQLGSDITYDILHWKGNTCLKVQIMLTGLEIRVRQRFSTP